MRDDLQGMLLFTFYGYVFCFSKEAVSGFIEIYRNRDDIDGPAAIALLEEWIVRDGQIDAGIIESFRNEDTKRLMQLVSMAIAKGYTRWPAVLPEKLN